MNHCICWQKCRFRLAVHLHQFVHWLEYYYFFPQQTPHMPHRDLIPHLSFSLCRGCHQAYGMLLLSGFHMLCDMKTAFLSCEKCFTFMVEMSGIVVLYLIRSVNLARIQCTSLSTAIHCPCNVIFYFRMLKLAHIYMPCRPPVTLER